MLENLLAASSLPNLHPALVHFPLALLPLAVGFDLCAVITARRWFDRVAVTLYGLGIAIGWWAAEVGEDAAESFIDLPAVIEPEIAEHSDMAHYALYAFALVFAIRLVLALRDSSVERLRGRAVRAGVLVIAAVGLFFLFETAEHGGALVYGHGLAVSSDATLFERAASEEPAAAVSASVTPGVVSDPAARRVLGDDGSLVWTPVRSDAPALGTVLFPVAGFPRGAIEAVASTSTEPGLDFSVLDRVILVFPENFGDARVEAELMLEEFAGTVGVAHHVVSAEAASWFEIATTGGAALRLSQSGAVLTLEAKDIAVVPDPAAAAADEAVRMAVSSTGRHRKGMINGEAVVHGHIDKTAETGRVGLLFDGRGRVRVLRVTVEPL